MIPVHVAAGRNIRSVMGREDKENDRRYYTAVTDEDAVEAISDSASCDQTHEAFLR